MWRKYLKALNNFGDDDAQKKPRCGIGGHACCSGAMKLKKHAVIGP
jgi:hypothetical protein